MDVSINISGEGSATGAGSYSMGDEVTLKATPSPGVEFNCFQIGESIITQNPYVFTVETSEDISLIAVFVITLEGYLRAGVGFEIPDATLMKIRIDRGILRNQDITTIPVQLRDLAFADCLMYGSNLPSQVQKSKDSDNGWSHDSGSLTMSVSDKRDLRKQARSIYKQYGDKTSLPTVYLTTLHGSKSIGNARY